MTPKINSTFRYLPAWFSVWSFIVKQMTLRADKPLDTFQERDAQVMFLHNIKSRDINNYS